MKILYLAPTEPFPGTHAGFTHVHNLLSNLSREGVEVTLLAGPKGRISEQSDIDPSIEIHHIHAGNPVSRNLKVLRMVLKLARKGSFDLVHERFEIAGGSGIIASRIMGLPHILEVNDPFLEINAPSLLGYPLSLMKRYQLSATDAIICQTPQIKKALAGTKQSYGIFVIPNGADPDSFPIGDSPIENRIGFMGSFMPWHGVQTLLHAFLDISREKEDARLILIGEPGIQRDSFDREIREMGLSNKVTMTGAVDSTEIPGLLSSCSVLVAPFAPGLDPVRKDLYRQYGFWWSPLKVFEYMAASRPVVTPDMGMLPHYLRDAGMLYPEGDTGSMKNMILSLLDDPGKARNFGEKGRKRIERQYNWEMISHMTRMAYLNVLEHKGRM